jgi:hypothetical protein
MTTAVGTHGFGATGGPPELVPEGSDDDPPPPLPTVLEQATTNPIAHAERAACIEIRDCILVLGRAALISSNSDPPRPESRETECP